MKTALRTHKCFCDTQRYKQTLFYCKVGFAGCSFTSRGSKMKIRNVGFLQWLCKNKESKVMQNNFNKMSSVFSCHVSNLACFVYGNGFYFNWPETGSQVHILKHCLNIMSRIYVTIALLVTSNVILNQIQECQNETNISNVKLGTDFGINILCFLECLAKGVSRATSKVNLGKKFVLGPKKYGGHVYQVNTNKTVTLRNILKLTKSQCYIPLLAGSVWCCSIKL